MYNISMNESWNRGPHGLCKRWANSIFRIFGKVDVFKINFFSILVL